MHVCVCFCVCACVCVCMCACVLCECVYPDLQAVDMVNIHLEDEDVLVKECIEGFRMGFTGMFCDTDVLLRTHTHTHRDIKCIPYTHKTTPYMHTHTHTHTRTHTRTHTHAHARM